MPPRKRKNQTITTLVVLIWIAVCCSVLILVAVFYAINPDGIVTPTPTFPSTLPTFTLIPSTPTASLPTVTLTACTCVDDILNCNSFKAQSEAQACYEQCKAQGLGDIHNLDSNNDGIACQEP